MKSNSYLIKRLGRDLKAGRCALKCACFVMHNRVLNWQIEDAGFYHYVPCDLRPTWKKYLPEGRELLTRKEAASMCRVSLRTLDRWDRTGSLRAIRVGKKKLYHRATIAKERP